MAEYDIEEVMLAFRSAMRRLAGGVAILTSSADGEPYGMTMTAVMSLAMEPPSLVAAVNRSASIAPILADGREFCVNLLHRRHMDFCERFSSLPKDERFSVGEWARSEEGTPYLTDAAAAIFCRVGPLFDFGTHRMVVGLVQRVSIDDEIDPLLHLDGCYRNVELTGKSNA